MASTKSAPITISSLKYIKPADLAASLRADQSRSKVAIVDVRDNDHVGGSIKGSQWVPINQLDARMPELLRVNSDKDRVVFHCMLSQQRGPKAALAYARAKASQKEKHANKEDTPDQVPADTKASSAGPGNVSEQEVCVLEGGFRAWQAYYGEDKNMTEGYVADIWED